jgi:hypothetical protein
MWAQSFGAKSSRDKNERNESRAADWAKKFEAKLGQSAFNYLSACVGHGLP